MRHLSFFGSASKNLMTSSANFFVRFFKFSLLIVCLSPPNLTHIARTLPLRTPHSAFRIPHSAFRIPHSAISAPHLRFPQLLQQQLFQTRVGAGRKEMDAARLAEVAQALAKVLHRLLIGPQAILAKSDLLQGAGF